MFVENLKINAAYHVILTDGDGIFNIRHCTYLGIEQNYFLFEDNETKEPYYLFETDGFVYDSVQDAVAGALFLFDAIEELT